MSRSLDRSELGALETSEGMPHLFTRRRRGFESVQIQPYDFKSPERISKEQMRALQGLHESFARGFSGLLFGMLQTVVEVRAAHSEQMTYSAFIASLPNPTCFNLISASGLDGQMCLEFSPLVTYPVIDRLLGGSSQDLFIPQREMTPIEARLMRTVLERAIAALGQAWSGLRELEFRLDQMASSPQIAQIVPPNEVVVVIGFEIRFNNRAGTMSLCIPFKVIEPVIEELGAQSWTQTGPRAGDGPCQKNIGRQLAEAPVQLRGVLAETSITVADLERLEVGDVIITGKPKSAPIVLEVTGRPKFFARLGQHRGARAVKILRPVVPGERKG